MLQKAIPIFPCLNIYETVEFYESRLGFKAGKNMGTHVLLTLGSVEIRLELVAITSPFAPASCFIFTDDILEWYSIISKKDIVSAAGKLKEKNAGIKEFYITDNNGNTIIFGERN